MPITCRIKFENNPHKIAFSGQKLCVTVRLKLTDETKVRGIYIQLRGIAHVQFSNKSGHHVANDDVLDVKKFLTNGNDEIETVPSGTHDYTFIYTLPPDLPSSISGQYGYIKYTANVVLRIPLWPNKKFEEKFTVFKTVNLNDFPSLQTEVSDTASKVFWSTINHRREIIGISARISTRGYAYGQNINLQVTVNNQTFSLIRHFIVYILREITYFKSENIEHKKTEQLILKKRTMNDWFCEQRSCKTLPMCSIQVPAMIPPTDTQTCKIIKIEYFVCVKGSFLRDDLVTIVDLPITIGTIPFGDSTSATIIQTRTRHIPTAPSESVDAICSLEPMLMESTAPVFPDDDTVSIRTYASTPPPFPDDEFDLPTYEEAVLMDQEIDINLQSFEDTFAQLFIKSTNK